MKFTISKLFLLISLFTVKISFADEIKLETPFNILDENSINCKIKNETPLTENHPDQFCDLENSKLFKGHDAKYISFGLRNGRIINLMIEFNKHQKDLVGLSRDIEKISGININSDEKIILKNNSGIYYTYIPILMTLDIIYIKK
jgi:hypothetical protein